MDPAAVAVRRGSTTMWVAPAARPASKHCMAGGMVAAGFEPTSRIALASARSASGNGSPRSIPKARLAAVAAERHAEPAVVVDHGRAQRDPGELAEARTPSRWSVRRRRSSRPRRGRTAAWVRRDPVGDQVERLVPVGGSQRAAAVARHRPDQRLQQSLRMVEQRRRVPALRAQPAAVGREVQSCGRRVAGRSASGQRDPALQGAVRAVRRGWGRRVTSLCCRESLLQPSVPRVTGGHRSLTRRRRLGEVGNGCGRSVTVRYALMTNSSPPPSAAGVNRETMRLHQSETASVMTDCSTSWEESPGARRAIMQLDLDIRDRRVVSSARTAPPAGSCAASPRAGARVTAVVSGPLPTSVLLPPGVPDRGQPAADDTPAWLRLLAPAWLVVDRRTGSERGFGGPRPGCSSCRSCAPPSPPPRSYGSRHAGRRRSRHHQTAHPGGLCGAGRGRRGLLRPAGAHRRARPARARSRADRRRQVPVPPPGSVRTESRT